MKNPLLFNVCFEKASNGVDGCYQGFMEAGHYTLSILSGGFPVIHSDEGTFEVAILKGGKIVDYNGHGFYAGVNDYMKPEDIYKMRDYLELQG